MASAIAMIMAAVQLLVVALVLGVARAVLSRLDRRRKGLTMIRDTTPRVKDSGSSAVWAVTIFFVLNVLAIIAAVVVSSFATRWLGTWLPEGFTTKLVRGCMEGIPARARCFWSHSRSSSPSCCCPAFSASRQPTRWRGGTFPGKKLVMFIFLLPLLVPPITFGIPLATVLYKLGVGGTFWGVVLANLVPTVPFVLLVMIPFIEQIDPKVEAAARVFGASTFKLFIHVLLPMLVPGILAALLLVLVRTVAMFELTFLTAGPTSQTLVVVALLLRLRRRGPRSVQSIDAMAVIYMVSTLIWLLIALRFVNPTQIVARGRPASGH